jgi:PAS domain S-box-containing protein
MAKKLPSILNSIEQGIWSYDLQKNKFNVFNQTMLSLLNLRQDSITSPDSWLPYIHPDEQPVVKKLRASLSEKYEIRCVYRYQLPGQNIKWISEHQVLVRDEQEALQIEGVLTDITVQKLGEENHAREMHQKNLELETANEELTALNEELHAANEEMQAANEELQAANEELTAANEKIKEQADIIARLSEEKINRILHSLNDVVWSVELPSNVHAYVSPAVEKIYGISIEEVLNNPFFWKDALHPDDKSLKESKLSQAFAEGYAEYTYRIIRSDNTICWLYDRVRVFHDDHNNPVRIDGISTDVTELVETQKNLEQRESQLKHAQHIAKIGNWKIDFVNKKQYWSDEIYSILEMEREADDISIDACLSVIHPEDREKVLKAQEKALSGSSFYDVQCRALLPGGKIKFIRDIGEITFNEKGEPTGGMGVIKDITEQKETETQLLETTERFTLATQSAEIGIWEWNIHDNSLIWDELTCGIFEVKKEEFLGSLDTWTNFLHPDTLTYAQQQVEKALGGDGNYNVELKIITATQKVKYVKSYAYVLFNEQHQPERMIGAMWDITWQKHAEEELIRYSERLDTVIGSITDGFFIVDREWKFIRVNQAFEQLNKVSETDIVGKNMWELFPNVKDTKLYTAYHHAMESNESISLEVNTPPLRWYHVSAYPSKEGLAVYFRDITQEKEIQQQIFFSERNLDALINTPTDIIWSIDKDMKFVSANNAYKALSSSLSGRTEIKTGDPAIMESYKDPVAQRFENYYRRALSGERFAIEESVMIPEKEARYAEVSFNPMYDKTGEVIGIGCFARDITERKKAEEEKSRLIKRLLEQNKYLEEFAFITSHNLRAPVARILGLTGIFNRKSMEDPLNLELVNNLEKSAHLLDEVIKDIARVLDIRKQEDEIREEVSLENIMMEVKELLAQEIEKTGAEITINFPQATHLYTIKSYLRNVLLNLVSNAIKYKKLDRPPQIAVESYYNSNFLCFSVKDNGLGIDLDKYGQQVFTLYKRFHSHTEGKGMGMYLIKSQVDALGGTIHIDSQVNEGTTVEVCLKNEPPKKE